MMREWLLKCAVLAAAASVFLAVAVSCSSYRKITNIEKEGVSASLNLTKESDIPELDYRITKRDTLVVHDESGEELLIMKAVRDDITGEMVANDVLDAAYVTARFRNVAERKGKVDIMFEVVVPQQMMDSDWQLRLDPDMFIQEDVVRLEPVIITGSGYRRAQLKGYQQYNRFLSTIITDPSEFINLWQLEIFLQRNLPEVYAFKTDSTEVSDERFYSYFGVSEEEAVEHYTNKFARYRNEKRKERKEKVFNRYVKAPIVTDGIRLDTVVRSFSGEFVYKYVQTIETRPRLRKVDIVLSGGIWQLDRKIYNVPASEPLTFYISSVSSFADMRERYMTKVIERRAAANTVCRIDFALGRSDVDETLGGNAAEIERIKDNLRGLMDNETFELDSIMVAASSSPEGSYDLNKRLSQKRSASVGDFLSSWMKGYQDSLDAEVGFSVAEDGSVKVRERVNIPFIYGSEPENWIALDSLVRSDSVLSAAQKEAYFSLSGVENPDSREAMMRMEDFFPHIKDNIYPRLRTVRFDFYLHRRGMVKDTVHTTVLDSVYMEGVMALKDMNYDEALLKLGRYNDYNTAVAFVALDRNKSALNILEKEKKTAQVNYMLAIVYARLGRERDAVECYLRSCEQNSRYVHRGNLDPEISQLIKLYGLNRHDDELLY